MNLCENSEGLYLSVREISFSYYHASISFKYAVLGSLAATLVKRAVRHRRDVPLIAMPAPK